MRLVYVLALLALAGCATPYQASGLAGGFSEEWLTPRSVVVSFGGNGFTGSGQARSYSMFRACELALTAGFSHIYIASSAEDVARSTQQVTPDRVDAYGDGRGNVTATVTPGVQTTISYPESTVAVVFLTSQDAASPEWAGAIDALFYLEQNAPPNVMRRITANMEREVARRATAP